MKRKSAAFRLIYIILIELIFIDLILIGCFVKKINTDRHYEGNIAGVPAAVAGTLAVKEAAGAANEPAGEAVNMGYPYKYQDALIKELSQSIFLQGINAELFKYRENNNKMDFIATVYDLSYECCGKYPSHPEYGITFSGARAIKGRTVAVDPEVIPLGSEIYIEFTEPYTGMNGWYKAEDIGSRVRGNVVDVFMGESASAEMESFGRRKVKVQIKNYNGNMK